MLTEHGDKLLDLLHTANSSLQRISTSVTWLLGSQLRWSAKAFYLLSCLLAFGICQQRRFSRAFWPIMALSLGSIAAERWLAGSHFGLVRFDEPCRMHLMLCRLLELTSRMLRRVQGSTSLPLQLSELSMRLSRSACSSGLQPPTQALSARGAAGVHMPCACCSMHTAQGLTSCGLQGA